MAIDHSPTAFGYPPPPPAPPMPLRPPRGLPPVGWYPESNRQPSSPGVARSDSTTGVCQVCQGPNARRVKFLRITGLVLLFRWRSTDLVACHDCGLAVGREQQSKTLLLGWFGLFSFFLNLYAVARNTVSLARVRRLPPSGQGSRPALDPGRPVFLRAGALAAVAIVGFVGFQVASHEPAPTWRVGACVAFAGGGTQIKPVACSASHDGIVVAHASSRAACPAVADGSTPDEVAGGVYCVDENI
jgi:hypothetical protein